MRSVRNLDREEGQLCLENYSKFSPATNITFNSNSQCISNQFIIKIQLLKTSINVMIKESMLENRCQKFKS